MPREPLLVVGHLTCDRAGGARRLGGAAWYAARALAALGHPVRLFTAAPADPLLDPLRGIQALALHRLDAASFTTFRHETGPGGRRCLVLEARAPHLSPEDLLPAWRGSGWGLCLPVAGECPAEWPGALPETEWVLGLQGWLRRTDESGRVAPADPPEVLFRTHMLAATLSEEDHPDAEGIARRLALRARLVAVTRGAEPVRVFTARGAFEVPVPPVERVRDTTGAGDVFTTALMHALRAGHPDGTAVRMAAEAAAWHVAGEPVAAILRHPDGRGLACAEARVRARLVCSEVPEDPGHAENTLAWLLKLDPDADEALRIAALAHDIDRATPERVRREDFDDYDAFKAAHARRGARLLRGILEDCGVETAVLEEACRLVERHEFGGDPRSDLLKDADSLSYFDVNLPHYYAREGEAETLRRCRWGIQRLSHRARRELPHLHAEDPALCRIIRTALETTADVFP